MKSIKEKVIFVSQKIEKENADLTGGRLIEFQLIEIVFYHLIEIMLIT